MARLGRTEGRRPISWALPGIKVFIVPLARKLKGDRTVLAKGLRLKVGSWIFGVGSCGGLKEKVGRESCGNWGRVKDTWGLGKDGKSHFGMGGKASLGGDGLGSEGKVI